MRGLQSPRAVERGKRKAGKLGEEGGGAGGWVQRPPCAQQGTLCLLLAAAKGRNRMGVTQKMGKGTDQEEGGRCPPHLYWESASPHSPYHGGLAGAAGLPLVSGGATSDDPCQLDP